MPGPLARGFAFVESEGGTSDDVIKLNSYFLELSRLPEFREVRDKYVNLVAGLEPAAPLARQAEMQSEWLLRLRQPFGAAVHPPERRSESPRPNFNLLQECRTQASFIQPNCHRRCL